MDGPLDGLVAADFRFVIVSRVTDQLHPAELSPPFSRFVEMVAALPSSSFQSCIFFSLSLSSTISPSVLLSSVASELFIISFLNAANNPPAN
jgi:hypothetical protein